jgi:hypothetical protein
MKKKIHKQLLVEVDICNICEKEIVSKPFNQNRIEMVRYLFDTKDFHAHENCINEVVRRAFSDYVNTQGKSS